MDGHWSPSCVLVLEPEAPREQWLAARRNGIGASDASAVLGLNKWSSPIRVWAEKTGIITEDSAGEAAQWGQRLEPVIAQCFAEKTGLPIQKVGLLRSVERPWQLATPDFAVVGVRELVEIKSTGAHMAHEWADGQTPDHAELQAQHQLAVTGYDGVHVAALIGGQKLEIRYITRDELLIAHLNHLEERFWVDHVLANSPPPATADDSPTLALLYPHVEEGKTVELPSEAAQWITEYHAGHAAEKEAQARKAAAANRLRQALGTAEIGLLDGVPVVSYPEIERTALNQGLMRQRAPKIFRRYISTTTSRRLTVKG